MNRWTDRQNSGTNLQMDKTNLQTNRSTDGQTDEWMNRWRNRQMDRRIENTRNNFVLKLETEVT